MLTALAPPGGRLFPVRMPLLVSLGLFVGLLVGVSGCDNKGKEAANSVSGKVTVGTEPVTSGEVVFVSADNKQVPSPIKADGTYLINDPPAGKVKILVRGLGGSAIGGDKGKAAIKEVPPIGTKGATPNPKYASPATTDLSYDVKPGKQTHNIELKP